MTTMMKSTTRSINTRQRILQRKTRKPLKTLKTRSPTSGADGGKITFVNVRRISLLAGLAALLLVASRCSSLLTCRLLLRGRRLAGSGCLSGRGRGLLFSFGRHCRPRVCKRTVVLVGVGRCCTSSDRRSAVRDEGEGRGATMCVCVRCLVKNNGRCAWFYLSGNLHLTLN